MPPTSTSQYSPSALREGRAGRTQPEEKCGVSVCVLCVLVWCGICSCVVVVCGGCCLWWLLFVVVVVVSVVAGLTCEHYFGASRSVLDPSWFGLRPFPCVKGSYLCAGCLVVITDHGPRAEVARVLRHELLVDSGEGRLEGLEEEQQKREEKEIGEERQQTQHNAQMTMHVWSDARWTT